MKQLEKLGLSVGTGHASLPSLIKFWRNDKADFSKVAPSKNAIVEFNDTDEATTLSKDDAEFMWECIKHTFIDESNASEVDHHRAIDVAVFKRTVTNDDIITR